MKRIYAIAAFAALFVVALVINTTASVAAEEAKKYTTIVGYDVVKDLAVIPVRDDVMVIDSRPMKRRYERGHIPGAVSIPDSQFAKMTDKLPADKSKLLLFYCGGEKCMLSHKSAYKAEALGHTDIKVYSAGYPDWIANGQLGSVGAAFVKSALEKDKAVVIDARPAKRKYAKGHVPGALSIPDSQFNKMVGVLPAEKSTPLVFYCGGVKCPLSVKSAMKAKALGYTDVRVFQGGYPMWVAAYGDGVAGMEPFALASKDPAIKAGEDGDTITVASFETIMMTDPASIHLVDVRDPSEFAAGAMPGAVNIPLDDLEDRVDQLPSDRPIVFVCATGARSGEAYDVVKLLAEDMKVFFLDATVTYETGGAYQLAAN